MRRELQQQLYENPLNPWERALIQEGLVPIFPESKLEKATGLRLLKGLILPVASVTALIAVACSGGADKNSSSQELENRESSGYELPFPKGETWFLTGGPHYHGYLPNGIRNALDFAPPELGPLNGKCPTDGSRLVIENRVVTASASGKVTVVGDDNNRNDRNHSVVEINDERGLTEIYVHIDKTKVKKGQHVNQGDAIGNPSCEFPPDGANEGPHAHVGLKKNGQGISIDGVVIGDWTVHSGEINYNGTVTQGKTVKTADTRRCATDTACGGIRNDLLNEKGSQKLAVAGPKSPIPPISGSIKEKPVTPTSSAEKPVEAGWIRLKSPTFPFQIDYPSSWKVQQGAFGGVVISAEVNGNLRDVFIFDHLKTSSSEEWAKSVIDYYRKNYGNDVVLNPYAISGQKGWEIDTKSFKTIAFDYKGQSFYINLSPVEGTGPIAEKMMQSFKLTDGPQVKFIETSKPTPTPTVEKQPEQGWQHFKSFDLPYQIDYPSNWQHIGNQFYKETNKVNPTMFQIASESVASWITLDDLKNQTVQEVKDTVKSLSARIQITETPNQTIAGQKAWRLETIVSSSVATPNQAVTYLLIRNGKAWTIQFVADTSEFNQNLPTFQKMVDSFKFLQ